MKTTCFFRYIFLIAIASFAREAGAQQELMLHQQTGLWQASATNPAFFPKDKRLMIGLPSFGLDAAHSGDITYNDLLRREGNRTILDLSKAIGKLEPENEGYYDQRFETVSLGLRLPAGFYLQAGHAVRINAVVNYPKALAELFWYGNAPYIGQTLNVGFSTTTFDWNELSLGLARRFGDRLTIGARAKFLSGISSLQTDDDHRLVSVYTDPDIYQLTLQTDYAFHSSSIISAIDTSGLGFDLAINELKNGFSANTGWAFDLGLQLQLGERLTLSASALDLGGRINWKENANYFRSNGSFTYDGVEIPGTDIINGTTDSLDFTAALDTLNDALQFQKTAESFHSTLPARFYIGGTFKPTERWSFGAVVHHQNSERRSATSVGVNAHWAVLKWLTLGVMYSVNGHSATNLGLSVVIRPGPAQLFIISDNALNAATPYGSAAVNFRFGGAVVF
ncbi:MAG: hypothetical protein IPH12_01785 [Saprospirales bacterium]|nr:hypothetical protein [Saprospirales bacterium]